MRGRAEFPSKLRILDMPMRYKIAHGGRGSGKSWSYARSLLIKGCNKPLRILCAREIQNSIKDSVHKLLADQIQLLRLGRYYDVLDTVIRGKNGTEFVFTGLGNQTVESIKSYEGIDICWVEEGQVISKRSWDILIPTIRKEDSEIWITMNPELDTDPTYVRFIANPPDNATVVKMNYSDNPWFPEVLEKERLHCLKTDPDNYPNIWEGECKPAVEGAIYFREVQRAQEEGRITIVPYDPMLKAHVVMDIGWNDAMAISIVQKHASEIRIIDYIEDSHRTIDSYSAELKEKRLNWGKVWLPHDGFSKGVQTGTSIYDVLKRLGWDVATRDEIAEMGVEAGIKLTRMAFGRMVFDRAKCDRLIECAKRYKRKVSNATMEPGSPVHDEFSHGADNLRYIAINIENMSNESVGDVSPAIQSQIMKHRVMRRMARI